jgi:hypothetical protein
VIVAVLVVVGVIVLVEVGIGVDVSIVMRVVALEGSDICVFSLSVNPLDRDGGVEQDERRIKKTRMA